MATYQAVSSKIVYKCQLSSRSKTSNFVNVTSGQLYAPASKTTSWSSLQSPFITSNRKKMKRRSIQRNSNHTRSSSLLTKAAVKQTYGSFEEMITHSETPVLVDFYATWCGPCQLLVPVLDEVGAATRGKLKVVKINTEKYPNLATKYNISALPTMLLFKKGQAIDRIEGMVTAQQLLPRINYFCQP